MSCYHSYGDETICWIILLIVVCCCCLLVAICLLICLSCCHSLQVKLNKKPNFNEIQRVYKHYYGSNIYVTKLKIESNHIACALGLEGFVLNCYGPNRMTHTGCYLGATQRSLPNQLYIYLISDTEPEGSRMCFPLLIDSDMLSMLTDKLHFL